MIEILKNKNKLINCNNCAILGRNFDKLWQTFHEYEISKHKSKSEIEQELLSHPNFSFFPKF
jgi:hypothetical protein